MIPIAFDLTYTGVLAEPRGWKTVRNNAYKDAGKFWHKKYAARHFTAYATRRYGYRLRTKKYNKYKWRKHGHNNPLVWSGESKERTLNNWTVRGIRGGGAVVVMRAPGLNRRPKRGIIRMHRELTTVIPAEHHSMAEHAKKSAEKGLVALQKKKRRKKTIRS